MSWKKFKFQTKQTFDLSLVGWSFNQMQWDDDIYETI